MSDIDMNIDIQNGADLNIDIDVQNGADVSLNIETAPPGKPGEPGKPGDPGKPGKDGVGIESIFQTVIGMGSGAKNEWMITLTDGRIETLTIYNGESGRPASIIPAGETDDEILLEVVNAGQPSYMLRIPKGKNGFSPTIDVRETDTDIKLIIKDVNSEKTVTIPKNPPPIEVPDDEAPSGGGTSFETDETLILENGVLRVNTTDEPEKDSTLPITSGAVYDEFEKAVALLKTI